ncbi:MAG: MmgE/PrpD family protein [Rhodospirillales bacterium]|nr:MmgE/PrpD family protein [Rhodospirillales bacterium]
MDPAENLVKHVLSIRLSDMPVAAVDRAKLAVLDTIAAAIGGSTSPAVSAVRRVANAWGGRPESQVIGFGERLPAPIAALVNGTMARALDFDDTMDVSPNGGHGSAYILPAAFAVAERDPTISGAELVGAIVAATDVYCRLQRSIRSIAIDTGRDNGIAVFGPTAAAIRLLKCTVNEGLNAFGIAYAQAAGEFQMYEEHADTVPLQQGMRARSGVDSALLAKAGLTGPHEVFLGRYGFYRAFEPEHDIGILLDGLGRTFLNTEMSVKLYPCCRVAHTAIAATLNLKRAHAFAASDVEAIRVGTNRLSKDFIATPAEVKWNPQTQRAAIFNMPYPVAVAAANGRVGIKDFLPPALNDPDVRRILAVTRVEIDPAVESVAGAFSNAPAVVSVRLRDGRELTSRVDDPPGHPRNPATYGDLEAKLRQCVEESGAAFSARHQSRLCEIVSRLEQAPDLSELFRALVPAEPTMRAATIS